MARKGTMAHAKQMLARRTSEMLGLTPAVKPIESAKRRSTSHDIAPLRPWEVEAKQQEEALNNTTATVTVPSTPQKTEDKKEPIAESPMQKIARLNAAAALIVKATPSPARTTTIKAAPSPTRTTTTTSTTTTKPTPITPTITMTTEPVKAIKKVEVKKASPVVTKKVLPTIAGSPSSPSNDWNVKIVAPVRPMPMGSLLNASHVADVKLSGGGLKPWERDATSIAGNSEKNQKVKDAAARVRSAMEDEVADDDTIREESETGVSGKQKQEEDPVFVARPPPTRKSTMTRISGMFKRNKSILGQSKRSERKSRRPTKSNKDKAPSKLKTATSKLTKIKTTGKGSTIMMTVAEIEVGGEGTQPDDEWEKLDPRAIEAAKWTDGEIKRVIHEIKTRGFQNDEGQTVITFGQLFDETDQIFDALSGILKTSKKYEVVDYEGEQLWQGKNDKTIVTLLNENHEGIKIKRRKATDLKSAPKGAGGFGGGGFSSGCKCEKCSKTIYQAEYVGASGKGYHKKCFRCKSCNKQLDGSNYFVAHDRNFRCAAHHREFEMAGL